MSLFSFIKEIITLLMTVLKLHFIIILGGVFLMISCVINLFCFAFTKKTFIDTGL